MPHPLINYCKYLDAHALWLQHAPSHFKAGDADQATLEVECRDATGPHSFSLNLALVPCRYGGVRAYFVCPGYYCARRCTKLYQLHSYWRCRVCHGLAYQTQRMGRIARTFVRREKLMQAYGGWTYLPPKPKGMHESTHYGLLHAADALTEGASRQWLALRGYLEE